MHETLELILDQLELRVKEPEQLVRGMGSNVLIILGLLLLNLSIVFVARIN